MRTEGLRKRCRKGSKDAAKSAAKDTAAQAGPRGRSSAPSTPVRVRPVNTARRIIIVRFRMISLPESYDLPLTLSPAPTTYCLPALTMLEDEASKQPDVDSLSSSEEDYRPCHPGPEPEPPPKKAVFILRGE